MKLDDIRRQIDKVDDEISKLYLKRMQLISEITDCKKQNAVPVEDKGREGDILRRITVGVDEENKKYIISLYEKIFHDSRQYQSEHKLNNGGLNNDCDKKRRACLIGKNLSYSFSKSIHEKMSTDYSVAEVSEDKLENFIKTNDYDFFNVTIPYKQKIMAYLDNVDESAKAIGCINTVVNSGGKKIGYNTDVCGLNYLFTRNGMSIRDKNVVILGSGATSETARAVCEKMHAKKITVVGRKKENNYSNIDKLTDTQILINTTPVGTYPDCNGQIVDLKIFPNLQFVADVVYNPLRSRLILQAENLGIACSGGLAMLVCQAVKAEQIAYNNNKNFPYKENKSELTNGDEIYGIADKEIVEDIIKKIYSEKQNIALIGMPSCGKTTIGKILAEKLNRPLVDIDDKIFSVQKRSASEIILTDGEEAFRQIEKQIIAEEATKFGVIIATGGGSVLLKENVAALKQNSFVVYLERDLALLDLNDRPLSTKNGVNALYEQRKDKYIEACDKKVKNDKSPDDVAEEIIRLYEENTGNKRT